MSALLCQSIAYGDIQSSALDTSAAAHTKVTAMQAREVATPRSSAPRVVATTRRGRAEDGIINSYRRQIENRPNTSTTPARTSPSGSSAVAKTAAATPSLSSAYPAIGSMQRQSLLLNSAPALVEPMREVSPGVYAWRKNITATVFWIGEHACAKNPVANYKSSWDTNWTANYGGYDDPDPGMRDEHFKPRNIATPGQNPFYVALPYNDITRPFGHKPEAERVIPWFRRDFTAPGRTVLKGKWVQIEFNGKWCFAQWEDCGPFNTEDYSYVFGSSPPKNYKNKAAGIDVSPAVRDYLGMRSGDKVNWRFVDVRRIPRSGPWTKWGANNPFVNADLMPGKRGDFASSN